MGRTQPDIALALSRDGIGLFHRAQYGRWRSVGNVPLPADDLTEKMAMLRRIAVELAGETFTSQIVIPDTEIRYATMRAPGPGADEQRLQIEAALDGQTPYDVTDLVFDWTGLGVDVQVAIVAQETLDEAEAFAVEHGFNPISLIAQPQLSDYAGEPRFGPTEWSGEKAPTGVARPDTETPEAPEATLPDIEEMPQAESADGEPVPAQGKLHIPKAPPLPAAAPPIATPADTPNAPPAGVAADPVEIPEDTGARVTLETAVATASATDELLPPEAPAPAAATPATPPPPPPAAPIVRGDEARRFTIFGARNRNAPKRRTRLMPVIAALLLVGLAAIWGAYSLSDIVITKLLGPSPDELTTATAPDAGAVVPVEDSDIAAMEPAAPAEPVSPADAAADYGRTGAWQQVDAPARPAIDDTEDVYIATIDRAIRPQDPVTLPDYRAGPGDQRFTMPLSPQPPGTQFTLDDRGLVVATASGAVTPDGVRIFAGRPGAVPPERPQTETAMAADPAVDPEHPLAGIRPRTRPAGLVERTEILRLGGRTRNELAALRPRKRPDDLAIVAAIKTDSEAAPAADAEQVESDTGTELAVLVSRPPRHRPAGFAQMIGTAPRSPTPAAVAPSGPILPSSASVTRRATDKDAIRLNRINLIGVYGTDANRRALIRLPSGRYVKVEIGDRVDGGKVAAIGTDSLRYVKRGKSVMLKMP